MSAEKMKDAVLATGSRNWKATVLKPVVMTWARNRWDFWVIEGTTLRGWNLVLLVADDADIMVAEGLLYDDDGEGGVAELPYTSADELTTVVDVDGNMFYTGLMCFEGGDVVYLNPSDDPNFEIVEVL